jgi:hypothetical protein
MFCAIFISIFFFTYVSKIEETVIKSQINSVIENFIGSSTFILTDEEKEVIKNDIIANFQVPDMSDQDRNADNSNKNLYMKSIIVFGIGIFIISILIISLWFYKKFNLIDIFKNTMIIFLIVACTEFLFVTFVTKNYQLIDENYITYILLKNLENYSKN